MTRFSEYFQLKKSQRELDFVDVDPERDVPLYVDPFAIESRDDEWSEECGIYVRSFFEEVLLALRKGDDFRATNLMSHLHEPEETYLGVSKGRPAGRGVGSGQAAQLITALKNSAAFRTGLLSDLSEMSLYVEGIDRDKISDLTTNIIRDKLIQYTKSQCNLHNIQTKLYKSQSLWIPTTRNWHSRQVELPFIDDDPVLLIPKYAVRFNVAMNGDEIYRKQITDLLVAENLKANSSLVQTITNSKTGVKTKKVFKKDVREKHKKSKNYIAEIVEQHPRTH